MRVLALEPYAARSHLAFLEGLRASSRHEVELATLPARSWKWRMRTSALHFAKVCAEAEPWDLLFVSDYLDLAELVALLPAELRARPRVLYMHENQLTYPLREGERRDHHYALTHLYAMCTADRVLFNSDYHRTSFFDALARLLDHVPDVPVAHLPGELREKSEVLALGVDTPAGEPRPAGERAPTVLWNHRWEYDKDPAALLEAMRELTARGVELRVRLLGERFRTVPPELESLRRLLGPRLIDGGFAEGRAAYLAALAEADVAVSTARHEFFGLGTLEAIRAGLLPVLPDDLAYPELLPPSERGSGRFLYPREGGLAAPLERALGAVRQGEWSGPRRELVAYTDGFAWPRLAPRYDAVFEQLVG